ncbi:MAG: glycosyltransferase [Patescibacteria group bacterium]|jgi:glycosyltransferase involved in cell wall biosynthesis
MNTNNPKIALAHDYLIKNGGAEKVLISLHQLFPSAPVFTLLYDEKSTHGVYKDWDIRTSYLQKRPAIQKLINYYRAEMPRAVESFDLSEFDVVISDSSSFIKGVITQPNTKHICYMHTPTRFLWFDIKSHIERGRFAGALKGLVPLMLHRLRRWDVIASSRPDVIIANSKTTQDRITKFYHKPSTVINPPVDVDRFDIKKRDTKDAFVIVSRLEPHKDVDLAIKAANLSQTKLVIIGDGNDSERLQELAGPTVKFLGRVSDQVRDDWLYQAKAFLAPQTEDFGITMVEALAAGCPVIARNAGGAAEIVTPHTGILIDSLDAENLADQLKTFDSSKFKPEDCHLRAMQFSEDKFKEKILALVSHN